MSDYILIYFTIAFIGCVWDLVANDFDQAIEVGVMWLLWPVSLGVLAYKLYRDGLK